jgi:outer membrane receptor protein involved in Fe transport
VNPSAGVSTNLWPPTYQYVEAGMERLSAYAYWTWEAVPRLWLTPGVAYDRLEYPRHLRHPPIASGEKETEQVSPKGAFTWSPLSEVTLRGAYAWSLGGVSFDESFRLEPTQLAGFSQGFRTLMPETSVGSVSAPWFETVGLGLDLSFKTRTYVTLQGQFLNSEVGREVGAFESAPFPFFVRASSLWEDLRYHEQFCSAALNQLVADKWSFGLRYQFAHAELERDLPEVPPAVFGGARRLDEGDLHQAGLVARWNHPSGWFANVDLMWYLQSSSFRTNQGQSTVTTELPGEEFPQLNLVAGYRFKRQRGEIAIGGLNLTGEDYRLNPINLYSELPRERVFYARLRLRF